MTDTSEIIISNSYTFDSNQLTAGELRFLESFPDDYVNFIKASNGGFVNPELCYFMTPIVKDINGVKASQSRQMLEEFYAYISYKSPIKNTENKPHSLLHEHIDKNRQEEFLPNDVIVIARCVQNSLIAISLNEHDYGSVYYWEWYWKYLWYKDYFMERINKAYKQYPNADDILNDPKHTQYQTVLDTFNYAKIVKINDSFSGFLNSLFSIN